MKFEMRSRDFTEFTLGTTAALTAVLGGTKIDAARLQGCSIEKLKWNCGILGKGGGVSEGPVAFGVSYDNTIAEIAAFYAADPQSQDDELELARSQLPILELGRWSQQTPTDNAVTFGPALRNATWPGWPIREGKAWQHYFFNANPNDPLTTGGFMQLYTEAYGEWRQD